MNNKKQKKMKNCSQTIDFPVVKDRSQRLCPFDLRSVQIKNKAWVFSFYRNWVYGIRISQWCCIFEWIFCKRHNIKVRTSQVINSQKEPTSRNIPWYIVLVCTNVNERYSLTSDDWRQNEAKWWNFTVFRTVW